MLTEATTYMMNREPIQKFTSRSLFPILSAEKLLAGPEHAKLLSKLQHLVGLSPNHYDVLYIQLIHQFAEFVQVLPLGESGRVASVLNEGLEHGLVSLELLSESGLTKTNQLLTYAVFSAALMQDVGKVAVNRRIMISDRRGIFIQEWLPHGQPMPQTVGSHFKIRYTQDAPLRMSSRVTPIFARQLMPEAGYSWIAAHPEIWTMWLAALGDTTDDDSGTVGIQLNKALRKLKVEKPAHLPEVPIEIVEGPETKLGEAFWEWLQEQLKEGKLEVDKPGSGLQSAEGGLLLHDAVFRHFHEAHMKAGDWIVTQAEFNHLGLTELSGEDKVIRKYYAPSPYEQSGERHAHADKAAHFNSNSGSHLSYLAKQFHSLTSEDHPLQAHSHQHAVHFVEPSGEAILIASKFLSHLLPHLSLVPKFTMAEEYFKHEMELELLHRPPLFQPEKKQ